MSETVYKIARAAEWESAEEAGVFLGSPDDRRDGFIHFSSSAQLRATYDKYFAGEVGLLLVGVDAAKLGYRLKWEISRGDEPFPHLYGPLHLSDVTSVTAIGHGSEGYPILWETR